MERSDLFKDEFGLHCFFCFDLGFCIWVQFGKSEFGERLTLRRELFANLGFNDLKEQDLGNGFSHGGIHR